MADQLTIRNKILRVTLELIGEHGIAGLTNRSIAAAAGISPGTLTYHFPGQDELVREVLENFVIEETSRLQSVTTALEDATVDVETAARMAVAVIEEAVTRREQIGQFEIYLHAARNVEVRHAVSRCYRAYDELSAAALKSLGASEPHVLAPALTALLDGVELRRLATGSSSEGLVQLLMLIAAAIHHDRTPG
ncbi:hypothetical protein BKG76_01350 [Mycobacteroides franklinii]|uniref:HTH tetR-type domain-containing protein n=1 Tax=Mycobacteroides franklinii TaxID=948102 RepID=A0A1S1LBQ0_9MYCO|nr:TetR/AcrR family transcriptional regulator [Mycobacteroides franklinii]OHU30441.1 hypothetical protein BKG76_01350 [Mycobacteroides franklinii]